MMTEVFEGKVAVITGAGCNIGRAEAIAFAKAGARVVVNSIDNPFDTVAEIHSFGGDAVACKVDASTWTGAREIIETAIDAFGKIDILINNAAIIDPMPIEAMTEEAWDSVVNVSLKGYAATIHHAAPHFIAQKSGAIINTGSTSGFGHITMSNYSAAKEGALGLTRSVARDLGRHGVRCNLIRPINFHTRMATPELVESGRLSKIYGYPSSGTKHLAHKEKAVVPTGEQVASLALLLCRPESEGISGQDFYIKGDEVGRFPEPELIASQYCPGGWTLDALLEPEVLDNLFGGVRKRYVHREGV